MLWLRVFHNRAVTAPAGAAGIADLSWRSIRSQAHMADRIQFLTGVWSEGLSSSLAPPWLLARRHAQFLAMWTSPLCSSQCGSQLHQRERKGGGGEGEGEKEEKEEGEGERQRGHLD